jgi:ubiquinol-cytochrome c reductase cytochrome b subunit
MKALFAWLDHRTGCKKFLHEALYENVPGGARWRYVWGSTLTFTLVVQIITGLFLWMAYSPSSQTAWESVYYIQNEMTGGWLLRGIHHFTAQAMNVLLVLHLMQVVVDGAYKAPREINYWFGFFLLLLVLGLSLTGYLLPWDQKGYWATKVATNIMAITPFIGPQLQRLILGGPDYGHHTLTRFFALHAGVLPGLIIVLVAGHIYLFRRHGLTAKEPRRRPDCAFWPDQVLKDAVACMAVMAAVLFLILKPRLFGHDQDLGAELGAPADASEPYSAARPEWYFLFLFQFLKYFPGGTEVWGAIVIPSLLLGVLFFLPFIGRWQLGHRFNLGFLGALLAGAGLLTWLAVAADRREPDYRVAVEASERDATRVKQLAHETGIPLSGAASLLRADPYTQGPKLFARNCANCHRYNGHDGLGKIPTEMVVVKSGQTLAEIAAAKGVTEQEILSLNKLKAKPLTAGQTLKIQPAPSASDLKDFASRDWLASLIDPANIDSPRYFGNSKLRGGKMVKFVKKDVAEFSSEQKKKLKKVIAALSAEAQLKSQREADEHTAPIITEGKALLASSEMRCTECHQFHKKDEDATAPDLTGYGSREWLMALIANPAHERFYGKRNDRMPKFGEDKILDAQSIGLIADWLRGDWNEPESKPARAAR